MFRRHEKEESPPDPEPEPPAGDTPPNTCRFCGKVTDHVKAHEMMCIKNPDRINKRHGQEKRIPCPYCGITFIGKRGLGVHINHCKYNPENQENDEPDEPVEETNMTVKFTVPEASREMMKNVYEKTGGKKRWKNPWNMLVHGIELVGRENNNNHVKPPARVDNLHYEVLYKNLLEELREYIAFPVKIREKCETVGIIKKTVEKPRVKSYTPEKEVIAKMVKEMLRKELLATFAGKAGE